MDYKHGIYGETGSASSIAEIAQGTLPIYIGTLPIQRIDESKLANVKHGKTDNCLMLLLNSVKEAKNLNLISEDWESYSLCEAIDVHFMQDSQIAPIVLVAKGKVDENTESAKKTVTLAKNGTSYIGYLEDSKAIIDDVTITVSGTTFANGEVSYEYYGDGIKIVIAKEGFSGTSASVTYKTVKGELMSVEDFKECLEFTDRVECITNTITNILCAPQYSNQPQYHDLMVQKAIERIDTKWNFVVASDIEDGEVTDIETAISWKGTNSYNNVLDKVFYPKLGYNGKEYHMSVVWAARAQVIDTESDGIPYQSASNKVVFADSIVNESGTMYISEREANSLNKNGITTAISMKGQIRLWGSHMANYNFDKVSGIPAEERFDVSVRMSVYIRNYLQYNYLDEVDSTITRKDIDAITNSVQMWLDSLVNGGMLLSATVEFDADSDLANGDIVFNIHVTYPFTVKSITFKVIYTDKGLSVLTEEEGDEE